MQHMLCVHVFTEPLHEASVCGIFTALVWINCGLWTRRVSQTVFKFQLSFHWHLFNRHADSVAEVDKIHNSESFHHANTANDVNVQRLLNLCHFLGMVIQFLVHLFEIL